MITEYIVLASIIIMGVTVIGAFTIILIVTIREDIAEKKRLKK